MIFPGYLQNQQSGYDRLPEGQQPVYHQTEPLRNQGQGQDRGRCQTGVSLVRDLFHRLALEALQIMAKPVALGMAKGQHDNELHPLHPGGGFGIHPAHAQPADTKSQSLQVQIHLLEQKADVLQVAFRLKPLPSWRSWSPLG